MVTYEDLAIQLIVSMTGALVGGGAGAYFGLILARNWDRQKRLEETNETARHVIKSIITELQSNETKLMDPAAKIKLDSQTQRVLIGIFIFATQVAFQSAVNSGKFSLLSAELQKDLGAIYTRFGVYNSFTDKIMNWNENPYAVQVGGTATLDPIMTERERLRAGLIDDIKKRIPELEDAMPLGRVP